MRLFVVAGFSNLLEYKFIPKTQVIAHGIRTGPAVNDGHERIEKLVENTLEHFKEAIFIVGGWDWRDESIETHHPGNLYQRRDANLKDMTEHLANQCTQIISNWRYFGGEDSNLWIEFGNELDLTDTWKHDIDGFYRTAMTSYETIRSLSSSVRFITGSTSNFHRKPKYQCWRSPRGWEILKKLREFDWPKDTYQGLHPYRNDLPHEQWKHWKDWNEALQRLDYILNGRRVAITEMGWHSGSKWDDFQIAEHINKEIGAWIKVNAGCYVHYQIQDSPKPANVGEGGFGAYTNIDDGLEPKQVQTVLANWKLLL